MYKILYVTGLLLLGIGVVGGLATAGFFGLIAGLLGSGVLSLLFFAAARILENQEYIVKKLHDIQNKQQMDINTVICEKCQKTYTGDYSSCPYCGYKS